MHVKLPKLGESGKLDEICKSIDLQKRGFNGEYTESVDGIYDISNKLDFFI